MKNDSIKVLPEPEPDERKPKITLPTSPAEFNSAPSPTAAPEKKTVTCLEVSEFSSWYGSFQALHDIELSIPSRQVTAFIGPSGCGKSTLLRWFNRMNDTIPSAKASGTLTLHGTDILPARFDVVDLRRRVGMVFQKPNPFPKSIFDNIAYGPRLHRRYSRSDLAELVEQSLRQAAIWDEVKDRLHQSALGLSGGQQQRLCIARAIAVGPEVLLMDEPCSALDPRSTIVQWWAGATTTTTAYYMPRLDDAQVA